MFLKNKETRKRIVAKFLYLLPMMVIIEAILGGIFYMIGRKYGSGLYWVGVGILNIIVVFLIPRWG